MSEEGSCLISKRAQFPKTVILHAVFFYVRHMVPYRAVDRDRQALDSMLSERREKSAVRRFFRKAIAANGTPWKVVVHKGAISQGCKPSTGSPLYQTQLQTYDEV